MLTSKTISTNGLKVQKEEWGLASAGPHFLFVLLVRLFADAKCHYSTNVSRSVREIYMLLYERRGKSSNNRDSNADAKAQRNPILFTLKLGRSCA